MIFVWSPRLSQEIYRPRRLTSTRSPVSAASYGGGMGTERHDYQNVAPRTGNVSGSVPANHYLLHGNLVLERSRTPRFPETAVDLIGIAAPVGDLHVQNGALQLHLRQLIESWVSLLVPTPAVSLSQKSTPPLSSSRFVQRGGVVGEGCGRPWSCRFTFIGRA